MATAPMSTAMMKTSALKGLECADNNPDSIAFCKQLSKPGSEKWA